jgi:hypothetical protein
MNNQRPSKITSYLLLPKLHYKPTMKLTKYVRNKVLDEKKAKRLCFWCNDKFVPGHRYKNKKLYSLCKVEDRDEEVEDGDGVEREEFIHEKITLYILINAL